MVLIQIYDLLRDNEQNLLLYQHPVNINNHFSDILTVTVRIRHPPRNVTTDTNGRTDELTKITRKAQLHTNTASMYPTLKENIQRK